MARPSSLDTHNVSRRYRFLREFDNEHTNGEIAQGISVTTRVVVVLMVMVCNMLAGFCGIFAGRL